MGKEKKYYTSYQAMPHRGRFWIHSESCYTEAELDLRVWVLKVRANSGIHNDYLVNPVSWVASDEQALVNIYENSWFFSKAYRTRHLLTRNDFLVKPIDNQRLQWPQLYNLMKETGNYLSLRNQNLPQDHLNQPMNFILLDLNNILKGISQNPNVGQTQEQLIQVMRYVRTIETNISSFMGSDRLFLANFRSMVEMEIYPQLGQSLESQLLKERLSELSRTIKQVADERHRILHFSLTNNAVSSHPYDFNQEALDSLNEHPILAAKECTKRELSDADTLDDSMFSLKISGEQLRNCPHFSLVETDENIYVHYAKALSDLSTLSQFQKVIDDTIELSGQAGEVYTLFQFKEKLVLLLEQVNDFIGNSFHSVEAIINANAFAYPKAIHDEQNLSFLKRWFTSEGAKLNTFIHNQDILTQYPSTSAEL